METKIFKNGQFQAVRIPKAYRLSGTVCEIFPAILEGVVKAAREGRNNWATRQK
jgi:virulence-associated protein VagC